MFLFYLAAVVLLVSIVRAGQNMYLDLEEQISECNDDLHCRMNRTDVVQHLFMSGGVEYTKHAIRWMKEVYHFDEPFENTITYFAKFSKYLCDIGKAKRREIFKKNVDVTYQFYQVHCANAVSEECVKFMAFMTENNLIAFEFVAQGYCESLAKVIPMPKQMAQVANTANQVIQSATSVFSSIVNAFG